MINVARYCGVF